MLNNEIRHEVAVRIREKINLVNSICNELNQNYSYNDIKTFLDHFKIPIDSDFYYPGSNFDFEYAKSRMNLATEKNILSVAHELDLVAGISPTQYFEPPTCWSESNKFRLFISHLAKEKINATRLKETLEPYNIVGFVAHEDITPTKKWQIEIEKALWTMDAMATIHTKGFSTSVWTQQEIGFALGRGIKVFPLRMDEDPNGFIGADQAILRRSRTAEQVSAEISALISSDAQTKVKMAEIIKLNKTSDLDDEIPF